MGKPKRRTLRVLRAERDLTQKVIAVRAGLTQTRYWQIEHGSGAAIRKEERAAIARILEVAPHEIDWPVVIQTELQKARAGAREDRRRTVTEASSQPV